METTNLILKYLLNIPKNILSKNYRFYSVANAISIMGFAGHLCFLCLFYVLDVHFLAYVNIGSCLMFLSAFAINRTAFSQTSLFVSWLEAAAHSVICVVFIGWGSGFYLYFLLILVIVFLIDFDDRRINFALVFFNVLILIILAYTEQFTKPLFALPLETLKIVDMINIVVISFTLSLTTFYYHNAVKKYELEVNTQKAEIEKKNKKITESINYARRIQYAILPAEQEIKTFLPKAFVFYQPKDIVSGDFYWFCKAESEGKTIIFAAVADCTGHGVPGAFMSLIGYNALNEVVNELKIYSPAKILYEVDHKFKNLLKQNEIEKEINDGMDIAIFSLENDNFCFSSAQRSLFLLRNGDIQETKGDKNPIGSYKKYPNKKFTDHQIILQNKDRIYMFSDGITDQFSADNTKKYGSRQLREFLLSLQKMAISEQKDAIEQKINQWKGNTSQTDDMLLMGFEV